MIEAKSVELCAQAFGDPADPPMLLIMGIGASMLWWDEDLCERLADGGRYVIRFDHRDTGRSVTSELGRPDYTGADLTDDVVAVLDAFDIGAAHIVGVSAGGGMAQEVALTHPDRAASLLLISTSPISAGGSLPPPTEEFNRWVEQAEVDWSSENAVIEYLVSYMGLLAGNSREFDEDAARELVRRDAERAHDIAAIQNHDLMEHGEGTDQPLSSLSVPTLVMHGSEDPMFPLEHGEALAEAIPSAELRVLEGAGHGVEPHDHGAIAQAALDVSATSS